MANKVTSGQLGTRRNQTFQREAAKIAGRARRTIYTNLNLDHTIVSATDLILQKKYTQSFLERLVMLCILPWLVF
jgi:hypothetical protein